MFPWNQPIYQWTQTMIAVGNGDIYVIWTRVLPSSLESCLQALYLRLATGHEKLGRFLAHRVVVASQSSVLLQESRLAFGMSWENKNHMIYLDISWYITKTCVGSGVLERIVRYPQKLPFSLWKMMSYDQPGLKPLKRLVVPWGDPGWCDFRSPRQHVPGFNASQFHSAWRV